MYFLSSRCWGPGKFGTSWENRISRKARRGHLRYLLLAGQTRQTAVSHVFCIVHVMSLYQKVEVHDLGTKGSSMRRTERKVSCSSSSSYRYGDRLPRIDTATIGGRRHIASRALQVPFSCHCSQPLGTVYRLHSMSGTCRNSTLAPSTPSHLSLSQSFHLPLHQSFHLSLSQSFRLPSNTTPSTQSHFSQDPWSSSSLPGRPPRTS